MKYRDIIEKMSLRQKLALLTDRKSLSDAEIGRLGVPAVAFASLGEGDGFPAFPQLARSWDLGLVSKVAAEEAALARTEGINVMETPDIRPALRPSADRLTEDPFLAGELGASCLNGIHAAGSAGCLSRYGLEDADARDLDLREDAAVIHRFFDAPFRAAMREGAEAVRATLARPRGDYADVNRELISEYEGGFLFCENVPHDFDMHYLLRGEVCLGGAVLPLDTALGRYRRLKELEADGSVSPQELEAELKKGTAIAEETIDEAVDRVIGFAHRVSELHGAPPARDETLARTAAESSIVLLKNEGVLPLAKGTRVAVIGGAATEPGEGFEQRFSRVAQPDYDLVYAGAAQGYDLSRDRSEELIPEAARLARQADVVLLFLGGGTFLPANRLALAEALSRAGTHVVAILDGGCTADMSFDKKLHATLLAPMNGIAAYDALIRVLTGRCNPCGKLTAACYDYPEELFRTLRSYKDAGRNRVGEFIGYRRYDTSGTAPRYPFGHGLGYSPFAYSAFEAGETGVRFTLTNRGEYAGKEIVQVYAGKRGVRPKKELVAFVKVELAPGESRSVEIPLGKELFGYYNEEDRSYGCEGGVYTIYIGASVSDIRLKGLYRVEGGERPKARDEVLSDYLQSESDLMHRGYVLKDARTRVLRNRKEHRILRTVALIVLAAMAAADVLLIGLGASGADLGGALWRSLLVVNFLLVLAVIALICERATRSKGAVEKLPADFEELPEAEHTEEGELEKFFFEKLAEREEEELAAHPQEGEHYFDETLTFPRICSEFTTFAAERGIILTADAVRSLFAALASVRCTVLRGPVKPLIALAGILGEYLGTPYFADVAEGYRDPEDVFYKGGGRGESAGTNVYRAVASANELTPYLQLAVLTHVRAAALGNYFAPLAERLARRKGEEKLPSNLHFLLILAEGQDLKELPFPVADAAAVICLEPGVTAPKEKKTLTSPLGSYQLTELDRAAKLSCEIGEELWKKLDKLEEEVARRGFYSIDNRLWLTLENFAAVCLASGQTEEEAFDAAVSAKLLVRMGALWKGEGSLSDAIDEIFGDSVPRCKRLLKYIETNPAEE